MHSGIVSCNYVKQQSLSSPMDKIKFTSAVFYVTLSPFKELLLALVVWQL